VFERCVSNTLTMIDQVGSRYPPLYLAMSRAAPHLQCGSLIMCVVMWLGAQG